MPGTRSIRIIWLCGELDVPLQVETIARFDADFKASPDWRAKSPTGKVPVFEDGDLVIYESGAIMQYLLAKYDDGKLVPPLNSEDGAMYLQWCWFAEATFTRPLGDISQNRFIKAPQDRIPEVIPDAKNRALLCVEAIDAALGKNEYLVACGFTAADIMTAYSLLLGQRLEVFSDEYPNVNRYLRLLLKRPALQRAVAA